ncbi:maleylpyruvate isomerase family mycothiol-dependent enzyme [Dactylosporangium fulvum]|uniref:TIGR03086 family metal-binding protein n=1 Tax=Dactylosporangium fulvum TaxID=53359 RepID=A0ABY5VWD0_9ACTN|nr:TIGR03086 family metal-binding protein [Dactylosporangium fulvum]UWP80758.1 TIGR03086 family metal-binding protein [Dactylosporangium fulvum]
MTSPAEEHRTVAGRFTELVRGAAPDAWDRPSPCPGWAARDVVRHLVEWLSGFLRSGAGVELPEGPSPDDDPVGAWQAHADAVQALLDDPATAGLMLKDRNVGELPVPAAITMFYTSDVFLHTWDLARATGQDERLDPQRCAVMLEGMLPMDAVLRASGHYGPRVEVPDDADPQTRLLAFSGRRP